LGLNRIIPVQIEAYFLAVNEYVLPESRVLDVGFGLGYGLNILAIKANTVYGIDIDSKAYEYCLEFVLGKNPKLKELAIYDGYNIPYPDLFFDFVTCVDVLEHVEDYHKLIAEMIRVSRKGVFISTPNRRPEFTRSNGLPMNKYHLREWEFAELQKIIEEHGKDVEWQFINGNGFYGPFNISKTPEQKTYALAPFIYSR